MANGNFIDQAHYTEEPTNPGLGNKPLPDYLLGADMADAIAGATNNTQPVDEPGLTQQGNRADAFGFLDFFNRIHVTPLRLDLGNLISVQTRQISVWNAFFVPHTLNQVIEVNTQGLTLTAPAPTPLVLAGMQEEIYEVSVSTEGPPTIEASYTFDFDTVDITVEVTGVRIVAWIWEANWLQPVVERPEWMTDIIPAYDGAEQRRQLLQYPRVTWEFTYDVTDDQRRTFENVMYAWGGRIWALPIWVDVSVLAEELPDGVSFIPIETAGKDFHAGGLGVVVGPGGLYEAFEVDSVIAEGVNTQRPMVATWAPGSRVYPARTARLLDPRSNSRYTRNYQRGLARFKTVEAIARTQLTEPAYRGYPVMTFEPNWRESPELDYMRKLAELVFTGPDFVVDESNLAIPTHSFRWTALTREDVDTMRAWLYSRRGRQKAVWMPTWSDDLRVLVTVGASQVNLDVSACGLVNFAQGNVHRRDIRIQLVSGTVLYRRVTGFATVDETTERMTMNSPLGELATPEQFERISWMHLVRQDTDANEIAWQSIEVAETMILTKGPRNDV